MVVVQVLLGNNLRFDLRKAIQLTAKRLPVTADETVQEQVLNYIAQRLRGLLLDQGIRYDAVDAVLAERGHDPCLAQETSEALSKWTERADWTDLLNGFSRCVRIVRDLDTRYAVAPERLTEEAAVALYAALLKAQGMIPEDEITIHHVLVAVQSMIPAINTYFDEVLVMDEDQAVRENRLGLLQSIAALTSGVADLSKLEGF